MSDNDTSPVTGEFTKNIKNYFVDESRYPEEHGYDWMSRSWGNGILDFMNSYDKKAREYYGKSLTESAATKDEWYSLYEKTMALLEGAKDVLSVMHIMVERWSDDEDNPWMFAERADAKRYNESLDKDDDTISKSKNEYNFWPNPEGNRFTRGTSKTRYSSSGFYGWPPAPPKEATETDLEWQGSYWYSPSTGYMYYPNGQIGHDAVYRYSDESGTGHDTKPSDSSYSVLPSYRSL